MCGICGVYNLNNRQKVDRDLLNLMCDEIIHRGPDDYGIFVDHSFGHAMRRLSIIDIAGGHQPIFSEDKNFSIVFNGEIYNYLELRQELIKRGYKFRTNTDTETILYSYIEFGESFLDKLNGMFAISIYNKKEKTLFLARDRIGIKPLYYYYDSRKFIFASEIKAIHKCVKGNLEINPKGLDLYLSFGYIPNPHTIFKNIYKLEPGYFLKIKNGIVNKKKYWDIYYSPDYSRSESSFKEEFFSLFENAVRLRMRSDVPFGAFLSGGIDSSLVVAIMQKLSSTPIETFSLGYSDDPFYDETQYAEQIAKQFGTNHHAFHVDSSILPRLIDTFITHFDEPFADYSAFPTYIISKYAREHVKVVLTGDGGDEIFAGYKRYYAELIAKYYSKVPSLLRNNFIKPSLLLIKNLFPASRIRDYVDFSIKKTNMMNLKPDERYFESLIHNYLSHKDKQLLLKDEFLVDSNFTFEEFKNYWSLSSDDDYLGRRQFVDIKTKLPEDMLTKVDRMTMAVSLEARIPFLDHNLIEFSTKIPSTMKMSLFTMKRFLKNSSLDYLPKKIVNRHKHGFSSPIDKWFRYDLKEFATEHFYSNSNQLKSILNYDYIKELLEIHQTRKANLGNKLFNILVLHLWAKKYL